MSPKFRIVVGSGSHPVYPFLIKVDWSPWDVAVTTSLPTRELSDTVIFLVSWPRLVSSDYVEKVAAAFVLHASDLPEGRGWSPHIWQILEGCEQIVLSAIGVSEVVDSGPIYAQEKINLPRNLLWNEIDALLFSAHESLIKQLISAYINNDLVATPQSKSIEPSHYRRRVPEDHELDPNESFANQFDLIRISNPERYPSFLRIRGRRFKLLLEPFEDT